MKTRIVLLLIAIAVVAVPSFAQIQPRQFMVDVPAEETGGGWSGDSSYSQGQYMDNPCTAIQDWVWVNYSAYVEAAQAAAGIDRYLFDENTTVGGAYAASGESQADVGYGAAFSLRQYHKVNTSDNFHVVTVINFDPSSLYTNVTVETACGDGTPYSAQ